MKNLIVLIFVILCTACSSGNGAEDFAPSCEVEVVFDPDALGDRGYNDMILYALQKAAYTRGFELTIHTPATHADGLHAYENWASASSADHSTKRLFIFASSSYADLIPASGFTPAAGADDAVLLFETDASLPGVATFELGLYGGAYAIGRMVSSIVDTGALLLANPVDRSIGDAAAGFSAGFRALLPEADVERAYLADASGEGYSDPAGAYRESHWLYQRNAFVFPLAGGSNMGVMQYTREYSRGIFTAGVDTDMSRYSTQVLVSLMKRLDLALDTYLSLWLDGEWTAGFTRYGLDSEFVGLQLSEYYEEVFSPELPGFIEEAIEKEYEYYRD